MSPMFITVVIGFALSVMALGAVAPSMTEMIYAKKVEVSISREEALMQQIIRYRAITGSYPTTMLQLTDNGYWRVADNDNGFGNGYTFAVDSTKGLIAINTTISDATKRAQYINNFRHVFKPVDGGSGAVSTTFVMPSAGSMGAPIPISGTIPVAATAPAAASNTWWYDTSGSTAVLKVSDGFAWKAASSQSAGPTADNIVTSTAGLPSTGTAGDVRYLYNAATGSMNSYVWYGSSWVQYGASSGGASSSSASSAGAGQFAFNTAFVVSAASCTFIDGLLGLNAVGEILTCSDPDTNAGLLPSDTCTNIGRFTYDINGSSYECVE